jgi:hypothetical protein
VVSGRSTRALQRIAEDLAIVEAEATARSQKDQILTMALGGAVRCALNEEFAVLEEGLERANGSKAKLELLAPKLELFSRKNTTRIEQAF